MAEKAIALTAKPAARSAQPADSWTKPEHAFLETFEPQHGEDGQTLLGSKKDEIKFQFNPKEVSITKSAKWARGTTKDKKAGPPEYSGAEPCKMSLELFFDSAMDPSLNVVESVDKLFRCCVPYKEFKTGETAMSLLVKFNWGSVTSFAAYVSQVQAKYTRFGSDGMPIRAVCTVSLEEIDITPPRQNPTSGSYSTDRAHTMVSGDSLAMVAYREYRDPKLWRNLATYNNIDDPMRVVDGARVLLPRLETLLASIG